MKIVVVSRVEKKVHFRENFIGKGAYDATFRLCFRYPARPELYSGPERTDQKTVPYSLVGVKKLSNFHLNPTFIPLIS